MNSISNQKKNLRFLVTSAMIGAIYAALTIAGAGLSYGPIQFRFSEALVLLAAITPAAIPGLTAGCLISNLFSPYSIWDILLGSTASLLAAVFAYGLRNIKLKNLPILAPLGAVVFNALLVSLAIKLSVDEPIVYLLSAAEIALGEFAVCYGLGIPFYYFANKYKSKILL